MGSSWGGGETTLTIKDVKDFTDEVMGVIKNKNKDEVTKKISDKLSKKFPSVEVADVAFRDKKTLISELDKVKRENYDGKVRQKIDSAKYSLYIHIRNDSIAKPFVNRKEIANIVTASMPGGLVSKLKNLIKADNVIFLRG